MKPEEHVRLLGERVDLLDEQAETIERLTIALKDARSYVESVALNATGKEKQRNYRGCVARIDAALKSS